MSQPPPASPDLRSLIDTDPAFRDGLKTLKEPKTSPPRLSSAARGDAGMLRGVAGFYSYYGIPPTGILPIGNTCGQAAIAAVADNLGLDIDGLPRDAGGHWDNDTVVNQIIADGHKPDVMFGGFGTSGGTIALALTAYGASYASCGYVGVGGIVCQGGWGWEQCWTTVQQWVGNGYPVPVLVDATKVISGQPPGSGHWPVLVDYSDGVVSLANCPGDSGIVTMAEADFLSAWNYLAGTTCGYSHCFVVAQK